MVAPSSLVATVLLTHEARGISLSDLADHVRPRPLPPATAVRPPRARRLRGRHCAQVSWLSQEVVARGGTVVPIAEAGRVVGHTLRQLRALVHFPEKGRTLEPLCRPRESALPALATLRNRSLGVFAAEALLATCLAARASEGAGRAHWVREAGLCDDFCYLAEVRSIRLPPSPRTNWTRLVLPPVLSGHVIRLPPSPVPPAHPPTVAPRLPATVVNRGSVQ